MTKQELRIKLVNVLESYLGLAEPTGDDVIIDKYNKIKDKGSYKLKHNDSWCAAYVSVALNEAGLDEIGGIDAYVPYLADKLMEKNGKKLSSSIVPEMADTVFYDWDGNGVPNHVGVVLEVSDGNIKVIEGNKNDNPDKVDIREIPIGWKFIMYYIRLDWGQIAVEKETDKVVAYKVVKGDTLNGIAKKYGTTWQDIYNANIQKIENPHYIYPDMMLKIPNGEGITYTVKKGDTLIKIANTYHTSWKKLAKDNGISNPNLIYPKQKLRIK